MNDMANDVVRGDLEILQAPCEAAMHLSEQALEKKYGTQFEVILMNMRSIANPGVAIVTCCPKSDRSVVFRASYNLIEDSLSDDYPRQIRQSLIKKEILDVMSSSGIELTVSPYLLYCGCDENISDLNVQQIIDDNPNIAITANLFVSSCQDTNLLYETVLSVMEHFNSMKDGISIGFSIWDFDEEKYLSIVKDLQYSTKLSRTVLQNMGPIRSTIITYSNGKPSVSKDEFVF